MNLFLKDKVIIVTGGANEIQEGIVKVLVNEEAIPVMVGGDESDNTGLINEIIQDGKKAFHVTAELIDPEGCKNGIDAVIAKFNRIDGIVNNTGINDGVGLENSSYETFMESLHKKLVPDYLIVHYALPELIKSKGPVVNIGSKAVQTSQDGTLVYAASDGGDKALTREWAVELIKYGIRVNAVIVPAYFTLPYEKWMKTLSDPLKKIKETASETSPRDRMITAEEIANMIAFLLSERSGHTTGQLVYMDKDIYF